MKSQRWGIDERDHRGAEDEQDKHRMGKEPGR